MASSLETNQLFGLDIYEFISIDTLWHHVNEDYIHATNFKGNTLFDIPVLTNFLPL